MAGHAGWPLPETVMEHLLKGMNVAILVSNHFEQVELTEPREILEQAGALTVLIAPEAGKVQGLHHEIKADEFDVDLTLAEADPDDFDAVLLPGGVINADQLRVVDAAQDFVNAMEETGKPIAVICHGAWLLVSADLVDGRTLTSWPTLKDDIRNAGGIWVDQEVVVDRNWVSSRKPGDLPAFNAAMVELFGQHLSAMRGGERAGRGVAGEKRI